MQNILKLFYLPQRKSRMELVKMKRNEVIHEIEEDPEVVQTIEKGDGRMTEDIDDDEVGRETGGDGEVETEEGKFIYFRMIGNYQILCLQVAE